MDGHTLNILGFALMIAAPFAADLFHFKLPALIDKIERR